MRLLPLGDDRPFTGWHMLAVVGLFFGTIIAVNIVMAFFATGTFPGLVVGNSYVASQKYNELLEESRRQDGAGWRHGLTAEDGMLRFTLASDRAQDIGDLVVTAHVGRPSTAREDRDIAFVGEGSAYRATGEPLPAGRWEVDVQARHGEEIVFRRTEEVFVPAGRAAK